MSVYVGALAAAGHELPLITTIAVAFTAAWVLGLVTHWMRLSPIVGYLVAGILIGPHTPGFVADAKIAPQLAELGVILLMFGVGLHFHLKDLLAVRNVAVPGAIGQSLVATLLGLVVAWAFGIPLKTGLVMGMAMAVASTVVLIRVLTDAKKLDTVHGHVAVGWLIVEDILTVVVLVLIPTLAADGGVAGAATTLAATTEAAAATGAAATMAAGGAAGQSIWVALPLAFLKLGVLVAIVMVAGSRVIPWVMVRIARLRSRELFTLTVLVMAIAIAAGSYYLFGASMALGAFLAGMVVGQSPVSQQAGADALPLRDAFAVLFFTSVGMLFDPTFVVREPALILACLGIVLVGKPLAAMVIVAVIGYPMRTALTVAVGLAQIGEFSFILSDLGREHGLVTPDTHNAIVACALVSITLNPMLFKSIGGIEEMLKRVPWLWKLLNWRVAKRSAEMNAGVAAKLGESSAPLAVVVGYGPVGRTVDELLRESGLETVVVDLNMDTVEFIRRTGRAAIYGDAFNIEVLSEAMPRATHLVISLPHSGNRTPLIVSAKLINPALKVFVRARYISEQAELTQAGADGACFEELESAVSLARMVMTDRGMAGERIEEKSRKIRADYGG